MIKDSSDSYDNFSIYTLTSLDIIPIDLSVDPSWLCNFIKLKQIKVFIIIS